MRTETIALHAGYQADTPVRSAAVPIYQTAAYEFDSADHAAALFNLEAEGFRYSRISNPTTAVLEQRVAALEGGVGALCLGSGHPLPGAASELPAGARHRAAGSRIRQRLGLGGTIRRPRRHPRLCDPWRDITGRYRSGGRAAGAGKNCLMPAGATRQCSGSLPRAGGSGPAPSAALSNVCGSAAG